MVCTSHILGVMYTTLQGAIAIETIRDWSTRDLIEILDQLLEASFIVTNLDRVILPLTRDSSPVYQVNPLRDWEALHLGVRLQVLFIVEHTSDLISIDQDTCDHTASRLCTYTEEARLLEVGKGLCSVVRLHIERCRDNTPNEVLPEID